MDTLRSMRLFVRVVESGSFTAAAHQFNTDAAHVSRAIADLETHLRTRLMNRTTRRIALTEAGSRYLQRCQQMLAYVDEAEAEAREAQARPSGRLRIHAMTGFGQHYILPALTRFRSRYPDVRIELALSQRMPDILEEGYDVSVTLALELPDSNLISQSLGSTFSIVCASPSYLGSRKAPRSPIDLREHDCLQMESTALPYHKWIFDGPDGQMMIEINNAVFQVNVPEAMMAAIRDGMGIGTLPLYAAVEGLRSGRLVRLLPQYKLHQINAYAVYPSRQYLDAKIKSFVAFLRDVVPPALLSDEAEVKAFATSIV